MTAESLNIDDFVDYRAEYMADIKDAKITGDQLVGRCPFHEDNKASFSANLKTGQCMCFCGCINSNFIGYTAMKHGISTTDATKMILERYGKANEPKPKTEKKKQELKSFTVKEYSLQKKLPEEWLKDFCRVKDGSDRGKTKWLRIPYFDSEGKEVVFRKRYGDKEFRWSAGSSGKLLLYGEWMIERFKKHGYAVLVEGESDAQSLWHMGIPALGVPGATNFKASMVHKMDGLTIFVHVEPDKGGETFFTKVCRILREEAFPDDVKTFSCKVLGVKDPSDLFVRDGKEEAGKQILTLLQSAKQIDVNDLESVIPEAIKGAPVNLRQPEGWTYDEHGIAHIDEKKMLPTMICRTPIILTQRLKSIESGEEKIEIAFKRDGKWQTAIFNRSVVFTTRGITALTDLGCTITSENAKMVVRFLEALEAENIDVITKAESTSTFGWQGPNRFLPGHAGDLVLDIEPSLRGWASAYHESGTFDAWKEMVAPHRERDKFRFILAAAFTAPLLRIVSQRIFIVYNWGDSKSGKSSGLKAALSVWGDPEHLMVNFNATQVALERMASFYNDLPLGIDERQLAGSKQEALERIIYMIASGTGRARGSKGGGLQALNTWRTVAIATGEEPIIQDTTQAGVSTRVLEVFGGPFTNEKDASLMHQKTAVVYGHAGPEFMRRILETDERSIAEHYDKMLDEVYAIAEGTSGSHVSGIAAAALADAMADTWIFKNELPDKKADNGKYVLKINGESWKRALKMAETIIGEQKQSGVEDVNENALQYLIDYILSQKTNFTDSAQGQRLGWFSDDENTAYLFPSLLAKAMKRDGFSYRKLMRYLADKGGIATFTDGSGKVEYSGSKWHKGKTSRVIEFRLGMFTGGREAAKDDDDSDFKPVSGTEQGNIPFDSEPVQEELPL